MNKKLLKLAQRRECLISQSALQRVKLSQAVDAWRAPLALADKGFAIISFIKKHPILIAGSSAILIRLFKKSFIGKWLSRGILGWQLVRNIHNKFLV
jgi:YqjK-like protein